MNLNEYQILAGRTMPEPGTQHWFSPNPFECVEINNSHVDLLHASLGLAGEAGEVVEHVKKSMFYGKPLDALKIKEEAGDLLWYIAGPLCRALGCTLEELAAVNVAKLKKRYPDKYTAKAAIARVDMIPRPEHPGKPPRLGLRARILSQHDFDHILSVYSGNYGAENVEDGCYYSVFDGAWFPIPELWEESV